MVSRLINSFNCVIVRYGVIAYNMDMDLKMAIVVTFLVTLIDNLCNHFRATEYFTESISYTTTKGFKAYKCSNYSDFREGSCPKVDSLLIGVFDSQSLSFCDNTRQLRLSGKILIIMEF
jgi:hypothetical protein